MAVTPGPASGPGVATSTGDAPTSEPSLTVDVEALGTVVRIATPNAEAADLVRRAWHLALHDGRPVEVPEERRIVMPDVGAAQGRPDELLSRSMVALTQRVTRTALRAMAGTAVFLHAGGICHPGTGAAFVYVAPGGTGKTTLTRTLGPRFAYISDETIAVGADGAIVPYLKPLSVRRSGSPVVKDERPPGALGLTPPTVTPWLAGLVILRRREGSRLVVEPVGTMEAIVALSPETSSIAALEQPLRRVAEVVERAGGLRIVTYSDAAQLTPLAEQVLGRTR